ncbi:MAG: FHA domain-containing protein [Planctomycetota bacterium]|nr:FHA domain-containing protein [Planctomycetota bacterium]
MNLREFYKSWNGRSDEERRQSNPGPFLLINWPVEENPWNRRLFSLQEGSEQAGPKEFLIGRVSACAIAIQEAGVSSRHALLQRASNTPLSRWLLVDLASTNGTYTEQTRLTPTEPELLTDGQSFLLGTEVQVRFFDYEGLSEILESSDSGASDGEVTLPGPMHTEITKRLDRGKFNAMLPKDNPPEKFKGGSTMRMTNPMPWPRPQSASVGMGSSSDQNTVAQDLPPSPPKARVTDAQDHSFWLNVEGHEPKALSAAKPFVLGRSANGTDLRLNHPLVSRRHVRLTIESGIVHVEDLGSANGTVVGSFDITGKKVALDGNSTFWIGPFCLKVSRDKIQKDENPAASYTTQLSLKLDDKASLGISYSGEISNEMPVSELLQGVEFNEKTGTLFIEGSRCQGLMSFKHGRPHMSECHGDGGVKKGEDAFYRLLAVNDGTFSFAKSVDNSPANLKITITGGIIEFSRQQDEQAQRRGQ